MIWSENPQAGGATDPAVAGRRPRSAVDEPIVRGDGLRPGVHRPHRRSPADGDQGLLHVVAGRRADCSTCWARRSQLGRRFGDGERDVAVLSDPAWRVWFGADPAIVGRRLQLVRQRDARGRRCGRPGLRVPVPQHARRVGRRRRRRRPICWVPMPLDGPRWRAADGQLVRGVHVLIAIGRLAPGRVARPQADDEVAGHAATLADAPP